MGIKGSQTTTQNQNQNQSQTYTPAGGSFITDALNRATGAANSPMNVPLQTFAGFGDLQNQAFSGYGNLGNISNPFTQQAQSYFSPQGAQQFYNPMAQSVMAGMKDIFGQQQTQNNANLVQSAGGVGADRIAVGQANLANQQDLAAGQTLAGLYSQAQNQAQQAGQNVANLGFNAQNAQQSALGAQYNAGAQQQNLAQQQLNAAYQQQLQQQAFPYQQANFLAGITGALAPGLGGTTQGYSNSNSQTTAPAPSMWSQILGAGTAGVGALGGSGAFGSNGWLSNAFNSNAQPNTAAISNSMNTLNGNTGGDYYGPGFNKGGIVNPFATGGDTGLGEDASGIIPDEKLTPIQAQIPQLHFAAPPSPQSGGGGGGGGGPGIGDIVKLAMMFASRGGAIHNPFANGGATDDATMEDRFAPTQEAIASGAFDPQGINSTTFERDPRMAAIPLPRARPGDAPVMAADDAGDETTASAGPAAAPGRYLTPDARAANAALSFAPGNGGGDFIKSPWAALTAAGLGIMGGTSPFAGVNIGQGGMQGLKLLEQQREASQKDQTIDQAARRLQQEAQAHLDQYNKLTPYQSELVNLKKQEQAQEAATVKVKPLPAGLQKDLGEKAATFNQLSALETGFKPEYAGYGSAAVGDIANWAARQFNVGNTAAADWWQQYQAHQNEVRHKLFGSALTATETAQWEKQSINPGMAPDRIKANLKRQRELEEGALRRRASSLAKQGYSQEAIDAEVGQGLSGASGGAPTSGGAAPQVGERKQFKQGWGVWDGKAWTPE